MPHRQPLEPTGRAGLDVKLLPAVVRPPAERRNLPARRALASRVLGEFREMPGLALTPAQAARLFGLPLDVAARILDGLVRDGRLSRASDGRFGLRAAS